MVGETDIDIVREAVVYECKLMVAATPVAMFDADVPVGKTRYIVGLIIGGLAATTDEHLIETGNGATWITVMQVLTPSGDNFVIPTNIDLLKPLFVVGQALNLRITSTTGAQYATVIYWDR